jgi:hypothetical protein
MRAFEHKHRTGGAAERRAEPSYTYRSVLVMADAVRD